MLVLIDNANLKEIESLYDMYPYDGVTTNPTILKNEHTNPIRLLKDIRSLLPAECQLHAQVISDTTEGILEEAHFMLDEIAEDLFIKVPVSAAGMKAIHLLKQEGVNITATAIYTAMQAFMAGKAGARYTAPYVNRLDNMGADGVQVAADIHNMFRLHNMECDVLAASFKNLSLIHIFQQHSPKAFLLCVGCELSDFCHLDILLIKSYRGNRSKGLGKLLR